MTLPWSQWISVGFRWDFLGILLAFPMVFSMVFSTKREFPAAHLLGQRGAFAAFGPKTHATRPLPDNWRPRNAQI